MSCHIEIISYVFNGKEKNFYRGVVELPKTPDGKKHLKYTRYYSSFSEAEEATVELERAFSDILRCFIDNN